MTLGLHCLAFQEMLREGFTCPNESPWVTISKLLLAFCISLSSNTENPGSTPHSRFAHFHLHFLFRTRKRGSQKKKTNAQRCLFATKFLRTSALRVHAPARACLRAGDTPARNSLLNFTWEISWQEHLCETRWDYATSIICLTSFFFFFFSSPVSPCPAVCHAGQSRTTCSEWGGLLPGRANRVRPKGRNKHGNFLT